MKREDNKNKKVKKYINSIIKSKFVVMTFVLLISSTCISDAKEILVNVEIINYNKLPYFSKNKINNILLLSSEIIKNRYQKDVKFYIKKNAKIEEYFIELSKRIYPFRPKEKNYFKILEEDSINRFKKDILKNCKTYGTLESLKLLCLFEKADGINDWIQYSELLITTYIKNINFIKSIKINNSEKLINNQNWEYFSLKHWATYIDSNEYSEKYNLILSNILLIDNDLHSAPPHTLSRGGIANGISLPASKCSLIAYYPVINENSFYKKNEGKVIYEKLKEDVIAYLIAHEIGTHLLMQFKDNYTHKHCLAKPCSGMNYYNYVEELKNNEPCILTHESLPIVEQKINKCKLRIDIFHQQGKYDLLFEEIERKEKLETLL